MTTEEAAHLRRAKDRVDRAYAEPLDVLALARRALIVRALQPPLQGGVRGDPAPVRRHPPRRAGAGAAAQHGHLRVRIVAKGMAGAVFLEVDDCRATFDALVEKGVEVIQEPMERFYGIDAAFRDDSGNHVRMTQRVETGIPAPG